MSEYQFGIACPTPATFVPVIIKGGRIVGVGYKGWPEHLIREAEQAMKKYNGKE